MESTGFWAFLVMVYMIISPVSGNTIEGGYILTKFKGKFNIVDVKFSARSRLHCAAKCEELGCLAFTFGNDFVCGMIYRNVGNRRHVIPDGITRVYTMKGMPRSCLEFDQSEEVTLLSPTGRFDTVYCSKEYAGRTTMFIHPNTLNSMTSSDIAAYASNASEVLYILRKYDGEQKWGIFRQMSIYRHYPLTFLKQHGLMNVNFVPQALIQPNIRNGLEVNGVEFSFDQCDYTAFSHLFFFKRGSESYIQTKFASVANSKFTDWPMANDIYNQMTLIANSQTPPEEYFGITIITFGGCGLFAIAGMDNVSMEGGVIGIVCN